MLKSWIFSTGKGLKTLLVIVSIVTGIVLTASKATITQAASTSFYVAPNGNDNGPGTLSAPWRTINHAANSHSVRPGDVVYIRAGTYYEYIQQGVSGSPDNPITYRNYPGETPVITGYGTFRWHILEHSHIRIEGMTFRDFGDGAIQIRTRHDNITDIAIVNCIFENQSSRGRNGGKTIHVTTTDSGLDLSDILIQGNTLRNLDSGDHPAIQVAGEAHHVMILNNVIAGTTSIGIGVAGRDDTGQPDAILIKGNIISEHSAPPKHSPGIYLDGAGQNIIVENNVIHDGLQGIKVSIEPVAATLETRYVIVRRNVLYNNAQINLKLGVGTADGNCASSGRLSASVAVHNTIYTDAGGPTSFYFGCGEDLRWKNNIVAHVSSAAASHYRFDNQTVDPSSWLLDYNLFQSGGGTKLYFWDGTRYQTLPSYQAGEEQDEHSFVGDPRFVNASQRDFHIRGNSPARNAGGALTHTTSAGSGTAVPVAEAWYFSDGLGLQSGDRIRIGGQAAVTVIGVNYSNHTLTVDRAITWQNGAAVSYDYSNSGPDIGAFEFVPRLTLNGFPADGGIGLHWDMNEELGDTAVWHLNYDGPIGDEPSPIANIPLETQTYDLTGLTNYTFYSVTLTAVVEGEPALTSTVTVMPTDHFVHLPVVQK